MSTPILIHLYSDGSYFEKNKIGGWGAVLFKATPSLHEVSRISGHKLNTCSLEMELIAADNALKLLKKQLDISTDKIALGYHITLFTDSRVLLEGLNQKIQHWRQKNWIHKSGNPVKYQSLWESLDALTQQYQVTWCWVKGHNGNLGNTLADQLARDAVC
ncbi:MAG: ribonuclease HI [Thiomicrorhabdus sp.]|nr:ribonuclease HI [Thiomicrorhabdus sp.]